jgi:hypothetical protein
MEVSGSKTKLRVPSLQGRRRFQHLAVLAQHESAHRQSRASHVAQQSLKRVAGLRIDACRGVQ